ncbi:prepilin-type N-terminal cleavage/methylation domain-containing protein, partial [Acinetobacter baumannii]
MKSKGFTLLEVMVALA